MPHRNGLLITDSNSPMYTFSKNCKKNQWKKRKTNAIVTVYPLFKTIPNETNENFEPFFWSELLLYKKFRDIPSDIGITREQIISNWKMLHTNNYSPWHVTRIDNTPMNEQNEDTDTDNFENDQQTYLYK